jgi:hypothetical protein
MTDEFTTEIGGSGSVMPASEQTEDSSGNILDELRKELGRTVERPLVQIVIPERPNIALRLNPNLNQAQLKHWRNNSGANSKKGLDSVKFSCYIIGETCVGIFINGKEAVDENGTPLTFASEVIWEMTNASDAFESIKDMFAVEPHLETAAMSIIEAAGYGDEVETEDPFSVI